MPIQRFGTSAFSTCLMAIVALAIASKAGAQDLFDSGTTYLAYNVWFEKPDVVWSINYKKGRRILAGTQVTDIRIKSGRKPKIRFSVDEWNMDFTIHMQKKFHPGLTVVDLANRLFTDKPLDTLTSGFSKLEKECVEHGYIRPGISREAVLVAAGYPPEHYTPSLELTQWYYWTSRMVKSIVGFDKHGKTKDSLL